MNLDQQQNTHESMDPKEVLAYMVQLSENIIQQAKDVEAMMEEAKDRGIEIDVSEKIKDFEPLKDAESQLLNVGTKLGELKSAIFNQGVEITQEEMASRLKKN